jgi:hypothetical protein
MSRSLVLRSVFFVGFLLVARSALAENTDCPILFKKTGNCGELVWSVPPKKVEMPTEKDKAEFTLRLFQKGTSAPLLTAESKLRVKLFMPSMGHGSLPTHVEAALDEKGQPIVGKYLVKDVYFSMPGKWEIRFELSSGDRILDQAAMPYSL